MNSRKGLLERLKEINRTVLEMELGILVLALLFQLGSIPFPGDRLARAVSLLMGSAMAFAAVIHMFRILDRALDLDEKSASKAIYQGYLIRYLLVAALILLTIPTNWLNPLLAFLGYLSLKLTAYLQPLTHKICNKIFHETDPVEYSEEELAAMEQEAASSGDAETAKAGQESETTESNEG